MKLVLAIILFICTGIAQGPVRTEPEPPPQQAQRQKPERKISPAEAQELFASVDEIMRFASNDTGMPIKRAVKRKLVSRDEVEKMLSKRMAEDKDAKRFERSELILKKFGMLPADFHLRPMLLSLMKEQVAGFYDTKERTINLLDWLPTEAQKPVLAHELTHALQDQQVSLEKWMEEPESQDLKDDFNKGVRSDEASVARSSATEGQAMIVLWDYMLSGTKRTLLDRPELLKIALNSASELQPGSELASAPLVIRESLIFPYREGLGFAFEVLKAQGRTAYARMLKSPPVNSHQILSPETYISGDQQPDVRMPELKKALRGKYKKFDTGAVGEFDLRLLFRTFKVKGADEIAAGWNGGMYYAGRRSASEPKNADDVAVFYVSKWKDEAAAKAFANAYAALVPLRYNEPKGNENNWNTSAGPVTIVRKNATVYVAEGFDRATANALITVASDPEAKRAAAASGELSLSLGKWAAALAHPAGLH